MQTSGEVEDPPTQEKPGSIAQVLLHPSPLTELPSSQMVAVNFMPSPQVSVHVVAGLEALLWIQVKPGSTPQLELHPSIEITFPSSHCSTGETRIPSPQSTVQLSGVFESPPTHFQPVSTIQSLFHPSPFTRLESSQ